MNKIPPYNKSDKESKDFLSMLFERLINENPFSIKENNYDEYFQNDLKQKYISALYLKLEKEAIRNNNFNEFKHRYYLFKKTYSVKLRWNVYELFVDYLLDLGKINDAINEWINLQEEEYEGFNMQFTYRDEAINRLMYFEKKLNKSIINGYHIEKIAPKGNQLTAFGKRNKDDVLHVLSTIINTSKYESFFNLFYSNYSFKNSSRLKTFPFNYYEKFFLKTTDGKRELEWHKNDIQKLNNNTLNKNGRVKNSFVKLAIRHKASSLLREAENEFRINIGAKKVGESWISETELFYKIKNALTQVEVIHHGKPKWLGRQHFDIWIPEIDVAIEYQGVQHDKPIDFFGGLKAFEENKKRDVIKKQKAQENNVTLIEVRKDYDIENILDSLRSIISKKQIKQN